MCAAQRVSPDPGGTPPNTLFIPEAARLEVLEWGHASKLACHPGLTRTLHLLRQRFWWPSMTQDAWSYIVACPICARGKSSHLAPAGLLHQLPVPRRPWSHIAMNFITGLPASKGNTVILTIVDRFSAHFVPLPKFPSDHRAPGTARLPPPLRTPVHVPGLARLLRGSWGLGESLTALDSIYGKLLLGHTLLVSAQLVTPPDGRNCVVGTLLSQMNLVV